MVYASAPGRRAARLYLVAAAPHRRPAPLAFWNRSAASITSPSAAGLGGPYRWDNAHRPFMPACERAWKVAERPWLPDNPAHYPASRGGGRYRAGVQGARRTRGDP